MFAIELLIRETEETIKFILVAFFMFGLNITKKKKKYLLFLYWPLVFLFGKVVIIDSLYVRTLWEVLLFSLLFESNIKRSFQWFWIAYPIISFIDMFFWIIIVYITKINIEDSIKDYRINFISIFFWLCIAFLCKKKRKIMENFWEQAKGIYYFLILFVLFGIDIIFGYIQIIVVGMLEITQETHQFFMLLVGIVILLVFVLCSLLLIVKEKNQYMEESNQTQVDLLHYQEKYYEEKLKKFENLAGFRHEFRHHMKIMCFMLEKNNYKELKRYIIQLSGSYQEMKVFSIGNILADYILNGIVGELPENTKIDIMGTFPNKMEMQEIDFCILFFNLLENAKEAIQEGREKKVLKIEVKNYQKNLYITIMNSIQQGISINLETKKTKKTMHGYGIPNIQKIVKKYEGEIEFRIQEKFFIVDIVLPILI